MALAAGPSIVNSGLVLALDAGDRLSYSGNGQGTTTWYDLSGNNKHFTVAIEASATAWNSAGYFELNGSRTFTNNTQITTSTSCTIVFWLKTNSDNQFVLFQGNNEGNTYAGAYDTTTAIFYSGANQGGSPTYWIDLTSKTVPVFDSNWHMWEIKSVNFSPSDRFWFNKYTNFTFQAGALASILVYNRNLTVAESAQNYNTMRRRFNI